MQLPSFATRLAMLTTVRTILFFLFTIIVIAHSACLHKSPVRRESIHRDMDALSSTLAKNPGNLSLLRDRRVGNSGFVYAIDREGIVIYHPQTVLAGMNFEGNPLVRRMLEMKSGCLVQYFEGRDRLVVFRPAGDGGVICLTIALEEVEDGRVGCEEMK